MCVHVLCVSGMPNQVLVWVTAHGAHTLVYVDKSLYLGGKLTDWGRSKIDEALYAYAQASLNSAQTCTRPPLVAVAG